MLLVWHPHARRAAYQAPADTEVQQEHADRMSEEGRRDCKLMCGGDLYSRGGRQGGMYQEFVYFQLSRADDRTVIQQLSDGLSKCQEGAPTLDPARENSTDCSGRYVSVGNVLSGNG